MSRILFCLHVLLTKKFPLISLDTEHRQGVVKGGGVLKRRRSVKKIIKSCFITVKNIKATDVPKRSSIWSTIGQKPFVLFLKCFVYWIKETLT